MKGPVNGNKDASIYSYFPMAMNVFTSYYYEQRYDENLGNYVLRVFVNNTLKHTKTSTSAYEYQNVKVYVGSPWTNSVDAIIKDFKFGKIQY